MRFSSDSKLVITSSGRQRTLWDVKNQKTLGTYKTKVDFSCSDVMFSQNNKQALVVDGNNLLILEIPSMTLSKLIPFDRKIVATCLNITNPPSEMEYFKSNQEKYYWKERAKIELFTCSDIKVANKVKKLIEKGKSNS
jgi:hypothetical protein